MQCLPKQVSNILPAVGGAILTLLHLLFSLFQALHKYFLELRFKWLERTTYKWLKSEAEESGFLISETQRLSVVPCHLVVILGTDSISLRNLVNLIVWSFVAGVSFVSIYDYKGSLKKCKDQLEKTIQARVGKKHYFSSTNGYKNTTRNGSSTKQVPCLSFLDASDGKELIVNAVRKLCTEASKGLMASGKPTQEELDQILIKESGLPEAELAIYFGPVCCMYGFMPWHARITEFLPLQDSNNIDVVQFVSVLRRYNKCEQRFGK